MASKKTLEQKLALAQDRLSKLKKKHRRKKEKLENIKKFTVGGEVTRVFGLDYDLALVVGFLEHFNKLSDEQKQALKKQW